VAASTSGPGNVRLDTDKRGTLDHAVTLCEGDAIVKQG